MPLYQLDGTGPLAADPARLWIAPDAVLIGRVTLGLDVSVWFGAVLRGDNEPIDVGDGSNIQDGAVVHNDIGYPVSIGAGCTIGHRAIVHGASVGDHSLVGMGATILNGAVIGRHCLVGANALVTEGREFPEGALIIGAPAKLARMLSVAEIEALHRSAETYVANGRRYAAGLQPVPAGRGAQG
ncbi:gamma carbonic anhydrase family protein [Lichenicoccus roseus]|uniref:Gamma carbonic anhydrase family protein n=1 Tax=Lichenicoccus roseus TaxID=2683649 RepID=A0A5R9JDR9_9PROT|nr:gamma carbonic anhydrase family protein [Lichenicoccus roseus]